MKLTLRYLALGLSLHIGTSILCSLGFSFKPCSLRQVAQDLPYLALSRGAKFDTSVVDTSLRRFGVYSVLRESVVMGDVSPDAAWSKWLVRLGAVREDNYTLGVCCMRSRDGTDTSRACYVCLNPVMVCIWPNHANVWSTSSVWRSGVQDSCSYLYTPVQRQSVLAYYIA